MLQFGFEDDQTSVKERAILYLYSYAWKDLWRGEMTGSAWFAEFRDQPLLDVLTANATRWARELGLVVQSYEDIGDREAGTLLDVAAKVDVRILEKAGVDLAAILKQQGFDRFNGKQFGLLDAGHRAAAELVMSWCHE